MGFKLLYAMTPLHGKMDSFNLRGDKCFWTEVNSIPLMCLTIVLAGFATFSGYVVVTALFIYELNTLM